MGYLANMAEKKKALPQLENGDNIRCLKTEQTADDGKSLFYFENRQVTDWGKEDWGEEK